MQLETFYTILRDAVKYYPQGERWLTPQCFRVLQHDEAVELTADNMGATICDIDTPYFYCKPWEDAGRNMQVIKGAFPLVTAFKQSATAAKFFTNAPQLTPVIGITVWDKYEEAKDGRCDNGRNRSINKIWADTNSMLLTILDFVRGVHKATFETQDGTVSGWYNVPFLQRLESDGIIADLKFQQPLAAKLDTENASVSFFDTLLMSDRIAGTSVQLNVKTSFCDRPEYTFETQKNSQLNILQSCC